MINLHVRSCYTLLNSTLRVDDITRYAKENNQKSIAIVDKNVMYSAMAFYHACKNYDIKPIFGLEIDLVDDNCIFNVVLYAKDDIGFQSLLKISTYLKTNNKSIDFTTLQQFDEHILVCLGGSDDDVISALNNQDYDLVKEYLLKFKNTFHEYYVAIAMNDSKQRKKNNQILKAICLDLQIQTYASGRIYYEKQEDVNFYRCLCAIDQQKPMNDASLIYANDRYFRSEEEMKSLYDQDDLDMSDTIALICNVQMNFEKATLPTYKNKYNASSEVYLRSLCKKGLEKRLHNQLKKTYVERLTHELDVIVSMGFADYFLIVYDFVKYARSKDILVGPGRGSGAGSLVAYCLGITQVDPLKYDLLFERFLNPERITMPDIDVDFQDNRRDEVIEYVRQLYGKENVAHITAFATLGAKQVIRDVGKALNIPLREVDMLCKNIPSKPKITLQDALANSRFNQMIHAKREYVRLLEIALKLEGLPRHTTIHASGVVISQLPITNVCPLEMIDNDLYTTQFEAEYLEELGLIKVDFLAIRNLTIIKDVLDLIKVNEHQVVDIKNIPLNDRKTFKLIEDVDTTGIFQLETSGLKSFLHKMKIQNFEEISTAISLYRPGPMDNIPLYLGNRSNPNTIDYMHPNFKKILESTYGVMVYQEQVMQIAGVMAGFSLGKADILRRAISKKHADELVNLKQDFIDGALKNGYEIDLINKVYDQIMQFAGYGYNKSHAVVYALIAYQMAYLKANYPLSFFTSLLDSVIGSEKKTSEYIFEAKKRNINVLKPDINKSGYRYTIENNSLRYPILNIKNVGIAAVKAIIEEREHGAYKDYFDFIARTSSKRISRKVLECLIDAGALDSFNIGRLSMKASLDDALRYASLVCIESDHQVSIDLDLVSKPALTSVKENKLIIANNEKEVLGFYLSEHPIKRARALYPNSEPIISILNKNGYVEFVCFIERIKEIKTKRGDAMCFLSVSDDSSKIDISVMPNLFRNVKDQLKNGVYLHVKGKKDRENSVLANTLDFIDLNSKNYDK